MDIRKMVSGKCRICGKEGGLSPEHVLPQSAFNKATVIEYTLENWTLSEKPESV
jgi:hypothetical protein